jgi:hypothetical protein
MLIALLDRFNGHNNGRIGFSVREMAHALGCSNFGSNSRAVGDLVARGLIAVEKAGDRGSSRSREFRITFISTGQGPGQGATNDYLHWRQGDAGTRKKPVVKAAAKQRRDVAKSAADRKVSAAGFAGAVGKYHSNSTSAGNNTVVDFAAHMRNHPSKGSSRHTCASTGSPWPDVDILRERVTLVVRRGGRGTQSSIATTAQIPGGTFSKFLRRNGSLPEEACRRLTLALARYWNREETAS